MPNPSGWQTAAVGLTRADDPFGLSRVAGLELTARCPAGSWPLLTARGGVRGQGSGTIAPTTTGWEYLSGSPDTTAATWLGTLSVPGHAVPSITEPESDWSHVSVRYGSEFTLTMSRATAAVLVETTQTTLRLCAGTVPLGWTTSAGVVSSTATPTILPKYVAYHTAAGYQVAALSATSTSLTGMDQPWLLIYWGNNSHFLETTLPTTYSQEVGQGFASLPQRYAYRADCPLLLTFGVNPTSIVQTAGVGGFDLGFGASPVAFSVLPLYGRARPAAATTDGWTSGANLASGAKALVSAWYPRCQQFPRSVAETYAWSADTATITETISWTTVRAGGTKFCPVPPMVGTATTVSLALGFSGSVVDGSLPTEYGPSLGIVGVDSYSWTLAGLAAYTTSRSAPGGAVIPSSVTDRLNAEVDALVAHPHWQPWFLNCRTPQGFVWGDLHWSNPSDTLAHASELLPLVSDARWTALKTWLDTERAAYPPETVYADLAGSGTARGVAAVPPAEAVAYLTQALAGDAPTGVVSTHVSLWAAWALARYYQTTGQTPSGTVVTNLCNLLDIHMPEVDWASGNWFSGSGEATHSIVGHGERDTASENVNRTWAGLCGLAWLCAQASDSNEPLVRALLAKYSAVRVGMSHQPRWRAAVGLETLPSDLGSTAANDAWQASFTDGHETVEGFIYTYHWHDSADDPRDVVHANQYECWLDDSSHRHQGWGKTIAGNSFGHLASARSLVKPLADLLLASLGTESAARVAKIPELYPHWYLPFTEPIGGKEQNIAFPADSFGIFLERAWLQGTAPATLEREAATSWLSGGGDLLYAVKLAETARVYAGSTPAGPYAANITDLGTIAKRALQHVTFDVLQSVATNRFLPYDPSPPAGQSGTVGITVDGEFSDDGFATTIVCPGTYEQAFDHQIKGGRDWLYPLGFGWHVRFSPPRVGTWQYRIRTTDSGGTNVTVLRAFTATAASVPGRVRVASADSRYFQTEDGAYRPLVGFNLKYASLDFDNPTIAAATLATLGAAGVNYARVWATDWGVWGSEGRIWESTQSADQYPYVSAALSSPTMTPDTGAELARYVAAGFSSSYLGHLKGTPPCKRSTTYELQIRYQIAGTVTGPLVAGHPYGLCGKVSPGWIFNYATEPEEWNKGTAVTAHASASTGTAWANISGQFTTGVSQDFLDYIILTMDNCTSGASYVTRVLIREVLGGGLYGPNLISQEWMDRHVDVDQRASAQFDLVVQAAETQGIALQTVMLGTRQEFALSLMADDGTVSSTNDEEHFFGPANGRQRWLHQAVARYFQGRWGYSSGIFGWEFVNEGSAYSARHFAAAQAWAAYLKGLGDAPLVGTSTQFDLPKPSWDQFPAADWVDLHLYRQDTAGIGDTLRVDTPTAPLTITVGASSDFNDTASWTSKLSLLVGARQPNGQNRPTIRGETGLIASGDTNNYSTAPNADTTGIWWHKYLWAQCNSGGLVDSYWYVPEHLYDPADAVPNHLAQTVYYRNWIGQFALSNGHWVEAGPVLSDSTHLRAFGQRDATNGRGYVWIDNRGHTWAAVVAGTPVTAGSGTLTVAGNPAGSYTVVWTDPYSGATLATQTVSAPTGTLVLTLPGPVSTDLAVAWTFTIPASGGTPTSEVLASFGYGASAGNIASLGYGGTTASSGVQRAPTTSDLLDEGWTDDDGNATDIWATLDEPTANDADFIRSPAWPAGERYRAKLAALSDPRTATGHVVRYRVGKDTNDQVVNLTVRLMQGATTIATWVELDIPLAPTTFEHTLLDAEANAITDYALLGLEFEADVP